mmetsp:Transcript_310/g.683  ORF Transcript_310/g.683 Transcript_310/m.683 type:complete len:237 (-) Transcript_310:2-712(-)
MAATILSAFCSLSRRLLPASSSRSKAHPLASSNTGRRGLKRPPAGQGMKKGGVVLAHHTPHNFGYHAACRAHTTPNPTHLRTPHIKHPDKVPGQPVPPPPRCAAAKEHFARFRHCATFSIPIVPLCHPLLPDGDREIPNHPPSAIDRLCTTQGRRAEPPRGLRQSQRGTRELCPAEGLETNPWQLPDTRRYGKRCRQEPTTLTQAQPQRCPNSASSRRERSQVPAKVAAPAISLLP